jgi:hypothetical protein
MPRKGSPAIDQPLPSISGRDATRVVRDAAKILEQELAAGLMAAKRVEERFIDVKQIRERNPDEVTQRFRRDAHEALDIMAPTLTTQGSERSIWPRRMTSIMPVAMIPRKEATFSC